MRDLIKLIESNATTTLFGENTLLFKSERDALKGIEIAEGAGLWADLDYTDNELWYVSTANSSDLKKWKKLCKESKLEFADIATLKESVKHELTLKIDPSMHLEVSNAASKNFVVCETKGGYIKARGTRTELEAFESELQESNVDYKVVKETTYKSKKTICETEQEDAINLIKKHPELAKRVLDWAQEQGLPNSSNKEKVLRDSNELTEWHGRAWPQAGRHVKVTFNDYLKVGETFEDEDTIAVKVIAQVWTGSPSTYWEPEEPAVVTDITLIDENGNKILNDDIPEDEYERLREEALEQYQKQYIGESEITEWNYPDDFHGTPYDNEPEDEDINEILTHVDDYIVDYLNDEEGQNALDELEQPLMPEEKEAVKEDLLSDIIGYVRISLDDNGFNSNLVDDEEIRQKAIEEIERRIGSLTESTDEDGRGAFKLTWSKGDEIGNERFETREEMLRFGKDLKRKGYDVSMSDDRGRIVEGSPPSKIVEPDPNSPYYDDIINHELFHVNDYSYFKEKGYTDEEILRIWDRDLESGVDSPTTWDSEKMRTAFSLDEATDEDNINKPRGETTQYGTYKGEPFSTDYGKFKTDMSVRASTEKETETVDDFEVDTEETEDTTKDSEDGKETVAESLLQEIRETKKNLRVQKRIRFVAESSLAKDYKKLSKKEALKEMKELESLKELAIGKNKKLVEKAIEKLINECSILRSR